MIVVVEVVTPNYERELEIGGNVADGPVSDMLYSLDPVGGATIDFVVESSVDNASNVGGGMFSNHRVNFL